MRARCRVLNAIWQHAAFASTYCGCVGQSTGRVKQSSCVMMHQCRHGQGQWPRRTWLCREFNGAAHSARQTTLYSTTCAGVASANGMCHTTARLPCRVRTGASSDQICPLSAAVLRAWLVEALCQAPAATDFLDVLLCRHRAGTAGGGAHGNAVPCCAKARSPNAGTHCCYQCI